MKDENFAKMKKVDDPDLETINPTTPVIKVFWGRECCTEVVRESFVEKRCTEECCKEVVAKSVSEKCWRRVF